MAKPLRIGSMIDVDQPFPDVVAELRRYAEAGFDHAFAVADLRARPAHAPGRRRGRRCPASAWARAWCRCTRATR